MPLLGEIRVASNFGQTTDEPWFAQSVNQFQWRALTARRIWCQQFQPKNHNNSSKPTALIKFSPSEENPPPRVENQAMASSRRMNLFKLAKTILEL